MEQKNLCLNVMKLIHIKHKIHHHQYNVLMIVV